LYLGIGKAAKKKSLAMVVVMEMLPQRRDHQRFLVLSRVGRGSAKQKRGPQRDGGGRFISKENRKDRGRFVIGGEIRRKLGRPLRYRSSENGGRGPRRSFQRKG